MSCSDIAQQVKEFQALVIKYGDRATEPRLRLVEVLIGNEWPSAEERAAIITETLDALEAADPFDWRPSWFRGLWQVVQGDGAQAMTLFERCYFEMPGELAPRLAMGVAAEVAGQLEQALPYYDRVGQVDPAYVSAHLGAARCHAKAGRLHDAVAVLGRVPDNHALHALTQLVIGETLLAYPALVDSSLLQRADAAVSQ